LRFVYVFENYSKLIQNKFGSLDVWGSTIFICVKFDTNARRGIFSHTFFWGGGGGITKVQKPKLEKKLSH
jgi:hypothetical protein